RSIDEALRALAVARDAGRKVTPRGGGTSQCGQTINDGVVIDVSKHLNRLISLDAENRTCVVEPGIVLDDLNRQLKPHGLWFPVDVSTASRATIGGMARNKVLGVCHFGGFYEAMNAAQHLVRLRPIAVELVDRTMIALGREIVMFQGVIGAAIRGEPDAVLIVEFAEEDQADNLQRLKQL